MLGGPEIQHYHQAVGVVVAETFEQARSAAGRVRVDYETQSGRYDLSAQLETAPLTGGDSGEGSGSPPVQRTGNFEAAFAAAPVKVDAWYSTSDESHSMMEPHSTIAAWQGDSVTLWTSNQMIAWAVRDLSETLLIPREKIRVVSPFIGGGFGSKLWIRSDAVLAALGSRAARTAGQGRAGASAGAQQHGAPAGDDPAHSPRPPAVTASSMRSRTRAGRATCRAASRRPRPARPDSSTRARIA